MTAQEGGTSPLSHIVDLLIEEALKMRASDIHVEPQENRVLIRYRIDGVLRKKHLLPKSFQAPLISRIKIMAFMDIAEKGSPRMAGLRSAFEKRTSKKKITHALPHVQEEEETIASYRCMYCYIALHK